MKKNDTRTAKNFEPMAPLPEWFDGKRVYESAFCKAFLEAEPMVCYNGSFFTKEGRVYDEDQLRRRIYDWVGPYLVSSQRNKIDGLLSLLRLEAYVPELPIHEDRIHVANGTLLLNGGFTEEKEYCRNRLPVTYSPDAPQPVTWLHFLSQLLASEDVLTLQEYMGYCLIPSTKAQKMLMLVGRGGEGKSRIGIVMRALFGSNLSNGNLSKVETNRFARADLEHMLVMVDDDMKLEALPQTNYIKTIITAELPLDLEKKSLQSYQGELYCRFLGFGNGSLKALYDRSDGFFRRQIILSTRRRPKDRIDDPYLSEKLVSEKEGIFLWCLEGLQRLLAQNYRFTISQRSLENMQEAISDGNNVVAFLRSEGYIQLKADEEASSRELYNVYVLWCNDNAVKPLSQRSFCLALTEDQDSYGLEATNNIYASGGKRVRGFLGIRLLQRGYP